MVNDQDQLLEEATELPPYVSYKTFNSFIEGLTKTGIPSRIDRSVMATLSGAVQSQLMAALKTFGLVSDKGLPTTQLTELIAADGDERREQLEIILHTGYPYIFMNRDFKIGSATTKQVEEAFARQGASGDTIRKCLTFFLAMSKAAGVQISPHIKPNKRRGNGMRQRKNLTERQGDSPDISPIDMAAQGTQKTIQLGNGGSVTLTTNVNILELKGKERAFIFDLIDKIDAYETGSQESTEK